MSELPVDFAVIGFPKCGTTALIRSLMQSGDIHIGMLNNSIESDITALKGVKPPDGFFAEDKINGHNFSAYVFSTHKIRMLTEMNDNCRLILCVRNPLLSLLSWHRMHVKIANGPLSYHFASVERDFFADCTIESYYSKFAQSRLQYHMYFHRLLGIVPADRILIVWQSRMAEEMQAVMNACASFLGFEAPVLAYQSPHVGFADRCEVHVAGIISAELSLVHEKLRSLIFDSGVIEVA